MFEVPHVPDHLPRRHRDQEALCGRPRPEVHPSPSAAAASHVVVIVGGRVGRRCWAEELGRASGWATLLRLDREEHLFATPLGL